MKKLGYLLLFFLVTPVVFSQKDGGTLLDVRPVTGTLQNDGHQLFYYLPRNIVRVKLTVTRTESIQGPYSEFSGKYMNINEGVIQQHIIKYDVSEVNFSRISIPDSSKYFVVSFGSIDNCPQMQLNGDGVILACNSNIQVAGYLPDEAITLQPENEPEEFFFTDLGAKPFMEDKTETGSKMVMKDSVMVKVPVTLSKLVPATPEENAANAAAFIRKLRKRRLKLVADLYQETNPSDGLAIEQMVKELDRLEKRYVELFTGKTIETNQTYFFDFEPDEDVSGEQKIIGWYSPTNGVTERKPDLRRSDYKPITVLSTLTGNVPNIQISLMDNSGKTPLPIRHGLYYRVPGSVELTVDINDKIIARQNMLIAQKGRISALPVDYLVGQKYSIEFYPETGAIKEILKNKEPEPGINR